MKNTDQIKALAVAIEEKDNYIRMLLAQQGNNEVQIAVLKELNEWANPVLDAAVAAKK